MKVIRFEGKGDVSVIRRSEAPDPTATSEQALIEIKAFALNRADILQRKGLYPPPPGETDIPGLEAAGVVISAPKNSRFKTGDRVMTLLGGGGYAEKVAVSSELMMPIPGSLSFEQAAAIPEAFLTAHHNLFTLGEIKEKESALIHAGASGVGTAAIQLLRTLGAEIFVTVGSEEKAKFCESFGPEVTAISYKTSDFAEVIKEKTKNRGVDVILDCIGASYLEQNLKSAKIGGRLVCIGTMGGNKAELPFGVILSKRIKIIGSTLRALPLLDKALVVKRFSDSFLHQFQGGTPALRPIVHHVYQASELSIAHTQMENNHNHGKLVIHW